MTKIVNGVLVIEKETEQQCEYCGETRECRPYGEGGKNICYPCGMKPENKEQAEKAINERIDSVESVIVR